MAQTFHTQLRRRILTMLAPEEEYKLKQLIRVENNSLMGYGNINVVYRHGKNGAARCADEFNNMYYLSELTEAQCQAILAAM